MLRPSRLLLPLALALLWLLAACTTPRPAPTPTPASVTALPPTDAANAPPTQPAAAIFDGWTLLYYIGPDQNRAPIDAAAFAPNDATAAQVAVQVAQDITRGDAAGATLDTQPGRYRWQDGALAAQTTVLPPALDAASLAEFVTWGTGALPARHTALILGGYGAIHILPPEELAAALRAGMTAAGAPPFDVVVLDAGLSARLDLLRALSGVAQYAVVTAEPLVAGALTRLPVRDPVGNLADARTVAEQLVVGRGGGGTPWAVIDLARLPAVADSLEQLAATLGNQIGVTSALFARARAAAALLPELEALPGNRSPVASGTLTAALLTGATVPADVVAASNAMRTAQLDALVLTTGPVAPEFPLLLPATPPTDGSDSPLPTWNGLLNSVTALAVPPPTLRLLAAPTVSDTVSAQQPALLRFELSGRQIDGVALMAGRRTDNGLALGYYQPLPAPAGGWTDGVYRLGAVWPPELARLSDALTTTVSVAWPLRDGTLAVSGLLQQPDGGPLAALLVFDAASGRALRAWRLVSFPQPEPLPPAAQFTPFLWQLAADGTLSAQVQAGAALTLATLQLGYAPVAPGDYLVGLSAQSLAGARNATLHPVTVSASEPITGFAPYVNPTYGFRLLYPDGWQPPVAADAAGSLLAGSNLSGTQQLQIKIYEPGEIISGTRPVVLAAESIKAAVVATWQDVAVLYEDATTIGSEFALRTAYGYIDANGERRGLLLTFIHNDIGYALDLDLPAADEAALLPLGAALAAGWQFVPYALEPAAGGFATVNAGAGELVVPEGYTVETLANGWRRYRNRGDGRSFFALRSDAPGGGDAAAVARGWIDIVARDVADIALSDPTGFALAGRAWSRYDFRYTAANGAPMRGLLLASVDDAEQVIWAEAPEVEWNSFVETVLATVSTVYGPSP